MAISRDQVFAAANQLAGTGEKPTLAAVRAITGGSFTTIGPLLSEWKAARDDAMKQPEPLPPAIADKLQRFVGDVWVTAMQLASDRLAAEHATVCAEREAMKAEVEEATSLADKLAAEADELQARTLIAEQATAKAEVELTKYREALQDAQRRTEVIEAKSDQLERMIEILRGETNRANHALEREREVAIKSREDYARLTGRREGRKD